MPVITSTKALPMAKKPVAVHREERAEGGGEGLEAIISLLVKVGIVL